MPILEPEHDYPHPVEPDSAWSESYYFNAYDPSSDTGLFTRIGIRPNEGTIDCGLSVWLPDGGLAEYRHTVDQSEMVASPLAVGGVRYELVDAMRCWRIVADVDASARQCRPATGSGEAGGPREAGRPGEATRPGHVAVDAVFESLCPAVGSAGQQRGVQLSPQASAATSTTGKGHLEQAGRWTGSVIVDGTRHEWDEARGNRDRSWGPRRWEGSPMWRWFSINMGDSLHFGGIRLGTAAGDLHRGWVFENGHMASIKEWQLQTELADDGLTQRVVHLVAADKRGRSHFLTGEVMRTAVIGRPGGTVINEGLTRWTCRKVGGEEQLGYGIAEYLHQVDADGRPAVAVV
ncbi:MAG: DUF7064 domain-containing protein [Acidimicrobiales bacterium]